MLNMAGPGSTHPDEETKAADWPLSPADTPLAKSAAGENGLS